MGRLISFGGTLVLSALVLASPLRAETLPIEGVYPAGNDRLAALNSLAMGGFRGGEGESLAFELEQRLRDVRVRSSAYFNIVPSQGNVGADGTLSGSASSRTEERNEVGQEQVCAVETAKGNCKKYRWVKVNCSRRIITLNYTVTVDGRRREGLFSVGKTAVNSELICPNSGEVGSEDAIVGNLISGVANEIRLQFAPLETRENIRVKEGTEGLQNNAKKKFKDAIRLTKKNITSACEMWVEVDQLVPNHDPTLFNLGLCAEARRDYDSAQVLYRRVAEIDRSERYATEAVERLDRRRHAERQIAAHSNGGRRR